MSFWKTIRANINKTASIAPVVVAPVEPANDIRAPVAPAIVHTCSRIRYTDLQHKSHVRGGKRHEGEILVGHHADVYPKAKIRLYSESYDLTFAIGDEAAYAGGNMTSIGKIVAITEKSVKMMDRSHNYVLDIAMFARLNRYFDAKQEAARNASVLEGC